MVAKTMFLLTLSLFTGLVTCYFFIFGGVISKKRTSLNFFNAPHEPKVVRERVEVMIRDVSVQFPRR